MKTAVLVIDVQQGLCEGAGAAFDCAGTISRINLVTEKARLARVPVIFIQHESDGGYLEHGSDAWQLANGLKVVAGDLKVRKTTPDSFYALILEKLCGACRSTSWLFVGCIRSFALIRPLEKRSH
jgi:nicotinamidase-related amidase